MKYSFETSLINERKHAEKADAFYKNVLQISEIIRYNTDSDSDLKMQLQDVDVLLRLNNISYKVSEKFREIDYADLYIEVFSKYPQKKGWIHHGSANAVLYFTPKTVYWITFKSLSDFCLKTFFPLLPKVWFQELYKSNKTFFSKEFLFNGKIQKINLIKAQSVSSDGCFWNTIGISVPFLFLKENGVKFIEFQLDKSN